MSGFTLVEAEVRAINTVIDAGGAPQTGPVVPWELLEALDRLIPCDELTLVGTDSRILGHYLGQGLIGRSEREEEARHDPIPFDGVGPHHGFWGHFWEDPCSLAERTGDYAQITTLSDFYTDAELRSNRVFAENVGPRGLFREALVVWPDGAGRTLRLLCWRGPGGDFTDRERFMLRLLRPHIAAAYAAAGTAPADSPRLSPRQTSILRLVALGFTNSQIASRLGLAEGTVRTHLGRTFERLGAASRTDAVVRAIELGIVDRLPGQ